MREREREGEREREREGKREREAEIKNGEVDKQVKLSIAMKQAVQLDVRKVP